MLLDDLAHAGQLALYWDFRTGAFLDYSGHAFNGTVGGSMGSPRPWLDTRPSGYLSNAAALPADNYSGCILLGQRHYTPAAAQYCIWIDTTHYAVFGTGGLFSVYGAGTIRNSASIVGATCVGWNHVAGATGAVYKDGSSIGAFSGVLDAFSLAAGTKYFFNTSAGTSPLAYGIKALVITSTVLSATQHSQLLADLAARDRSWSSKSYSIRGVDSSPDANTPYLVWAPDLQHPDNQGTVQDLSPTGATGTKVGVTEPSFSIDGIGGGRTFSSPNYYQTGAISFTKQNDFTVNCVVKVNSVTGFNMLIASNTWYWTEFNAGIRFSSPAGTQVYDATGLTLVVGKTYMLTCCLKSDNSVDFYADGVFLNNVARPLPTGATSTYFTLCKYSTIYSVNKLYRAEIYSKAFSAAEVRAVFEKSQIQSIRESSQWGVPVSTATRGGVAGSYLESTRWAFGTTTPRYKIDVSTVSGKPIKTIACTTAGPIKKATDSHWTHQQAAYGVFEFSFYKGADANAPDIYLTSSTGGVIGDGVVNGYCFRVSAAEVITLVRVTAGVSASTIITVAPAISNTTWYRVRVTRDFAGNWKLYLLGGTYLGWTLVGSSAAPDNTHTTSYFQTLDLDALDLISIGTQDSENAFTWSPFV